MSVRTLGLRASVDRRAAASPALRPPAAASLKRVRASSVVALRRIHQLVHQAQPGHGVLGVADGVAVGRARSCVRVNFSDSAAPPTSSGTSMPASCKSAAGDHHLLRALHQQAGEPDGVGLVLAVGLDQRLRRHLDAQVDHLVAVVGEDDLDQVLADVVDVALHRGQHDLAARGGVGLLHELLEVVDRGLHRFGRLQHLGDDQLVVVEQAADFGHAGHQRTVDDVERRGAFGALEVQIGDQAVLGAFDDVVGQALIERQIGGLRLVFLAGLAEMLGDGGDVELVDGDLLFARSAARQSSGAVRSDSSSASAGGVLNSRFSARRRSSSGMDAKRSSFSALTIARSSPALVQ